MDYKIALIEAAIASLQRLAILKNQSSTQTSLFSKGEWPE